MFLVVANLLRKRLALGRGLGRRRRQQAIPTAAVVVADASDELLAFVLGGTGLGFGVADQGVIIVTGVEATDGEALLYTCQPATGRLDALDGGRFEAPQGGGPTLEVAGDRREAAVNVARIDEIPRVAAQPGIAGGIAVALGKVDETAGQILGQGRQGLEDTPAPRHTFGGTELPGLLERGHAVSWMCLPMMASTLSNCLASLSAASSNSLAAAYWPARRNRSAVRCISRWPFQRLSMLLLIITPPHAR
ncbi:hypothetical protein ACJ7V3_07045 [Halomonas elongata]|uniref:hypothetical protein n=1 Tax=Halomonas elongata TaxID=2746 RepID=UPI0038D3907B